MRSSTPGSRRRTSIRPKCRTSKRSSAPTLLREQIRHLFGVPNSFVAVAVVEHHVQAFRLPRQLLEAWSPLLQLFRFVEIVESLGRRDPLLLPVLPVVAVEA